MRVPAAVFISVFLLNVLGCSHKDTASKTKEFPANETEAGVAMQHFVKQVSKYAKTLRPGFAIVPQNGSVLAYTNLDPKQGKNYEYISAIDGFGVEELFYNEEGDIDSFRVALLESLKNDRKILVSEYIPDPAKITGIAKLNLDAGFVPFVRMKSNYNYSHIPERIRNQNQDDITEMDQVRNYLYLINPEEFDSKEEYLSALCATDFDLLIIDLCYGKEALTTADLKRLKTKAQGGNRLVICYMNIGSAENWRSYWKKSWKVGKPEWIRKKYAGFEGEYYVEFWNPEWQEIIFKGEDSYLRRVLKAGFDGTYLDNTEAFHYLYN